LQTFADEQTADAGALAFGHHRQRSEPDADVHLAVRLRELDRGERDVAEQRARLVVTFDRDH
jgi:hypothetical protein